MGRLMPRHSHSRINTDRKRYDKVSVRTQHTVSTVSLCINVCCVQGHLHSLRSEHLLDEHG